MQSQNKTYSMLSRWRPTAKSKPMILSMNERICKREWPIWEDTFLHTSDIYAPKIKFSEIQLLINKIIKYFK